MDPDASNITTGGTPIQSAFIGVGRSVFNEIVVITTFWSMRTCFIKVLGFESISTENGGGRDFVLGAAMVKIDKQETIVLLNFAKESLFYFISAELWQNFKIFLFDSSILF